MLWDITGFFPAEEEKYFETFQWFIEVDRMTGRIQQYLWDWALHFIILSCSVILHRKLSNFCIISPHGFASLFELLQPVTQCGIFLEISQSGGHQRRMLSEGEWEEWLHWTVKQKLFLKLWSLSRCFQKSIYMCPWSRHAWCVLYAEINTGSKTTTYKS